jgi:surface polysaccharide O-acyltransferase-like enzyme
VSKTDVEEVSMTWLDNSRIVATFAVVLLHTAAVVVLNGVVGSGSWLVGNLYESFVRWCVPVFVMISGALLLDPAKNEDLRTFYTKRASRITVPLLFWSAFYLLYASAKGRVLGAPLSPVDLLTRLILGQPYFHMWFLYMMVTLYLFTPFLRKIVVGSTRGELTILTILAFLIAALSAIEASVSGNDSKLFFNLFLSYIPYFFLGYLIRTDKRAWPKPILWGVFLLSSCLTAFGCYIVATYRGLDVGLYFYGFLSITVIPMSVSIMYLLKSWTSPIGSETFCRTLSALTFGVYLVHIVPLHVFQFLRLGPLEYHPAVSIPVIAVVVFVSSAILSWMIYRVPYLRRVI